MPFTDDFVIAIVGGSTNGKTTILSEIFPELKNRGWLQTQMNDTTSQSLRIERAVNGVQDTEEVLVTGWNLKQIKNLFADSEVEDRNAKEKVIINYGDDRIEVDGAGTTMGLPAPPNFPKSIELKPFSGDYRVTEDERKTLNSFRHLQQKHQHKLLELIQLSFMEAQPTIPYSLEAVVKPLI